MAGPRAPQGRSLRVVGLCGWGTFLKYVVVIPQPRVPDDLTEFDFDILQKHTSNYFNKLVTCHERASGRSTDLLYVELR